jgi:hypothetical protein
MVFRGENPPAGAIIDYWLGQSEEEVSLTVFDGNGVVVQELEPTQERGINRATWNLRHARLPDPAGAEPNRDGRPQRGPEGPWVAPGTYTIQFSLGDKTLEQSVDVLEDPRVKVSAEERQAWTETLHQIGDMYVSANALAEKVLGVEKELGEIEDSPQDVQDEAAALHKLTFELRRRIVMLYRDMEGWTGPPTEEQRAQLDYLTKAAAEIEPRVTTLISNR